MNERKKVVGNGRGPLQPPKEGETERHGICVCVCVAERWLSLRPGVIKPLLLSQTADESVSGCLSPLPASLRVGPAVGPLNSALAPSQCVYVCKSSGWGEC